MPCLQTPANIIQIYFSDKRNSTFPVKVAGTNAVALYDTSANLSCVSLTCYSKLKDLPTFTKYTSCLYILQWDVI